jgi:PKD repeat protein
MGWAPDSKRWEWDNDNDDPLQINWAAMNTTQLDELARTWLLPIKQAVENRGDTLYMNISPSFYDPWSSGEASPWFLRSPGEYLEYATSIILRLRDEHGITPYTYTICNEAGYNNAFNETIVLQMAKALGRRMEEMGLSTRLQYPESMSDSHAILWMQNAQNDAELWKYVKVISYHLYGPRTNLEAIRDLAFSKGVPTAQTEFLAGNSQADDYLYDDMTLGGVSDWESYAQVWPNPGLTGSSLIRSQHFWLFRQFMPYVRPGAVRVAAVSGDSTVRPLSFIKNGEVTVLLINTLTASSNQTVTLSGLPNGQYGICQSISEALPTELGIQIVTNGQLSLSLLKNAFTTVYPHNSGNLEPVVLQWQTSDAYLKLGVSSSTTLSVDAMDPELDPLSYQWSVATNPPGASVVLAAPTNKSCAVSGLTVEGEYGFSVTVSDATHSKTREVTIKVLNGNQPPMMFDVHQRAPIRIIQPVSSTTLRGNANDVEGSPITLLWSVVSQPAGAAAVLTASNSSSCIVTGLTALGDYTFRITASDGTDTSSQDLSFSVYPQDINPPVISNLSGTLNGDGSGHLSATTSDADGDWISHWWEQISGPTNAKTYFSAQGSPVSEVYADTAGSYQFRLIAVGRNQYKNSSTITLTLSNTAAPSASFTVSPASGWVPMTVTFTDISSGSITNRYWDFGDGETTNTAAASLMHTYTSAGTNTVQLIVSGPNGSSTNTQADCVRVSTPVPPSANFTLLPASGTAPLTVTFTDTSTGSITNRAWDFGDGFTTNTTATSISHIYSIAGTSTVQLIVSGPLGASTNTQIAAVTVTPPVPPSANFTALPTSGTAPLAVTFTDTSTGTITNRFWSFGDGATTNTTVTSIAHTYTSAGTNTVQLIASGPAGASTNTQTGLITVAASVSQAGLLVEEHFDYSASTNLTGNTPVTGGTWGGGGSSVILGSGLGSPGGFAAASGNKIKIGTSGLAQTNRFATVNSGTVYMSYLIQFNSLKAGGVMMWGGLSLNGAAEYAQLQYTNTTGNTYYQLGLGGRSTTAGTNAMIPTQFTVGQTQLVVVAYTFVSGAANDIMSLWINPNSSTFGAGSAPAADLTAIAASEAGSLNTIDIKNSSTLPFNTILDEMRVGTNWASVLPAAISAPSGDADSDGIPDEWETQYFGGATNAHPHAPAANGVNTIYETYIAGLNPTNPASVLLISDFRPLTSQSILQWQSASGRVYSVHWTTNLMNSFQSLETNIIWPQNSWTDLVHGAQGGGFYKINVKLGQ